MRTLFIITNAAGHIPQKIIESDSISADKIKKYFTEHNFDVKIYSYQNFIQDYAKIRDIIPGSYFFYASSQYPDYYSAFEDVLLLIKESGGILIPDFTHFRAHENKYFQELVKTKLKIKCPSSFLISSLEEGLEKIKLFTFPIVAKLSSGFGSSNVTLIRNLKEAEMFLEKNLISVVKKRKNIFKYRKQIKETENKHPLKVGKIIFQEFISGIENDWKILLFGNKIFYLKRYFKENDFRASGSGIFDNSVPPSENILKFAAEVKSLLKTPWVSLDIIEKENNIYLIEYQCVHFGLYTVMKSSSHFEFSEGKFRQVNGQVDEDMLFAEDLLSYINQIEKQ
jgi:glutathione synthase/RimK-type ligase-like ATP-grasp enzyme